MDGAHALGCLPASALRMPPAQVHPHAAAAPGAAQARAGDSSSSGGDSGGGGGGGEGCGPYGPLGPIDYYTTNLHKWLCGAKGGAVLWVSPARHASMRPLVTSHGCGLVGGVSITIGAALQEQH